jgi:hypothetical protein
MALARILGVGAIVCVVALVPPSAESGWGNGSDAGNDQTSSSCNAGSVLGTVGVLTAFSTSGSGSTVMTTTGDVGASWNGTQVPHASAAYVAVTNYQKHAFSRLSSGASTLTVNLTSQITQTGSAHRATSSPGWWWDSTSTVNDTEPNAQAYTPGTGWNTLTLTASTNQRASGVGGDFGDQTANPPTSNNNSGTNPPSSTSQIRAGSTTNGVYGGSASLPDVDGAQVVVLENFHSSGQADVDNAVVSDDTLKLSFTFTTSVN